MIYYAIQNKATGRYISGTDFSCTDGKPRQIGSTALHPPLLLSGAELDTEIKRRGISLERYRVVAVEIKEARL